MQARMYYSFLILLIASQNAFSQDLPRRAFFGIRMEAITEDVRRVMHLSEVKGVLIQDVLPASTAEAAGLKTGDVLLTINDQEVNSPDEAVRTVGALKEGQSIRYTYIRAGKAISEKAIVAGMPFESYHDLSVSYHHIKSSNGLQRTIVTRPKAQTGRLPALLFIQGISCYSMDTPFDTARSETQLLNAIARQGFVVMRVEKSGMGDSNGKPCREIDLNTELEGYSNAYKALQAREDVDISNCFIFGHSMGAVMAPQIAKTFPVKGIIVFGALGVNFMEYFALSRRNIAEAYQMSPAEADDFTKEQCACASMLLSARLTREEAVERLPACGHVYDFLLERDKQFWYQLNDLNIPALWQNTSSAVLSIRGNTDYITTRHEHEYIAEVVNQFYPGQGTFMELTDCDHAMQTAATYEDALNRPGPYNPKVSRIVTGWLNTQRAQQMTRSAVAKKEKVTSVVWTSGVENAYPRFSADGNEILFQSNRSGKWHLYLMKADGSDVRQLTEGNHNNNFPDWSLDEKHVAFVSDRDGNEEIYVMDLNGTNLKRLTENPARDIHPYFSPDGRKLLFNSSRDNANSFEIYEIQTDGKQIRRITETPEVETCARYSPDSRQIVYLKGYNDGSDEIFVMNADGTNHRNVTNTPQMEGWPAWSPDSKKIIFSSRRNGHYCLYEMQADGSNVRQISFAEPGYEDARAGYAGTGDKIVFNRQRSGTIGISILHLSQS